MRIKKIIMLILILAFLYVSNLSLIESHERSHQEINRIFGCDSEVSIGFLSGKTTPINCILEVGDARELRKLHAMNEMNYVFMTMGRIMIFLIVLILVKMIIKDG